MSEPTITVTEHQMHIPRFVKRELRRGRRRDWRRRVWATRSWSPKRWREGYRLLTSVVEYEKKRIQTRYCNQLLYGVDYIDAGGNPIDAAEVRPES